MKILYVVTGLGQGGAERVVCDLADNMYEKGHQVKIVYLVGDVLTYPSNKEIELVKADLTNVFSLPKVYLLLLKIIKDYCPDVVHSHMVHANILTRLVRIFTPINKLISTAHNSYEGGRLRMLAYRITHNLSDVSTNVSQQATQAFEVRKAVPIGGMITIYNGINLNKFEYVKNAKEKLKEEWNLSKDTKVILAVGRFSEQKDYPNLLRSFYLLKHQIVYPLKLIIAGDGELKELIESIIKKLNLEKDVILLGRRNDIPYLMSAADIFVLSSEYEGFGLVIAEAMTCKCIVVATDSGGVAEVMGSYGKLVKKKDSIELSKGLLEVLSMTKEKKELQKTFAYEHVTDNFDLNNISNTWENIYRGNS